MNMESVQGRGQCEFWSEVVDAEKPIVNKGTDSKQLNWKTDDCATVVITTESGKQCGKEELTVVPSRGF